jgi:antitoxin HicB
MKAKKDIAYFEALPYTTILKKDDEGDVVARVVELPGCIAHGKNQIEATASLNSMFRLWIEDALESGDPIPEPEPESLPSGKWVQRVPKTLHRDLAQMAEREDVSLNQLVTAILSQGVTARACAQIAESHFRGVETSARSRDGIGRRGRSPQPGAKPGAKHR